jgi:cell wall-associated NlpC family hydrolase
MISLLALGTLFGPTLLSSQQVFADESSTVASTTPAPQPTENSSTTPAPQPTENSSTTPAPQSTENSSITPAPQPTENSSTEGTDTSVPDNSNSSNEIESLNIVINGKNGTYYEDDGNSFKLEGNPKPNTKTSYTIKIKDGFELNNLEITDSNNNLVNIDKMNNSFIMPSNGAIIHFIVKSKSKPKPDNGNGSNTNNQNNHTGGTGTSANNGAQNTPKPAENQAASSQPTQQEARQPEGDASAAPADVRVPSNQPAPTFSNDVQTAIVQEAYRYLGKPYVWGAKGPNAFDCSGLAYVVYANATGHNIGGWTGDQQYAGTQIPVSEAQPGDLLFWGAPTSVTTHVAIYIGNGQYIHAPQPGDVVKIGNISDFTPTFAVRVNIAGLPKATGSLSNAFGEYSTNQPFIFNKNQTTDQFIKKIGETSREIGQKNDIYSSVMIAQAILESGSGNSSLASEPNYNLFGIKGKFKDQGVTFQTLEQDNDGANFQITSEFRKYPSYKESLEDYAKLIKKGISGNEEFYKSAWKDQTDSYKDATNHLQGRYATDKQYAEKLNAIIAAYDLTEFDHAKETKVKAAGPEVQSAKTVFDVNDRIQSKLIASLIDSPRIPQIMSTKQFVNLFRGESLIALATTALPTKTAASISITLSNGLLAIIPPIN